MIGGTDIVIPSTGDSAALDICARIVRCWWPQARFEDAATGEKYSQYGDIPLGCVHELLAYRDAEAEHSWDAGEPDAPVNSMLYFIVSPDCVTVVLDDPAAAEMQQILTSLQGMLEAAIHRTYTAAA